MRTRRLPLGWLALGACVALLAYLRLGDAFGDRGMRNVFTGLVLAVAALCAWLALAFRRGLSPRRRAARLAGPPLAAAVFLALVDVDGVSGEMVPRLAWRFRGGAEPAPGSAPAGAARATLAPPSGGDFPGFLGARRDNSAPEARLARDWASEPPRLLWRAPIGTGWSAFAVAGGLAFTLEQPSEPSPGAQRASAHSAETGALAWSTEIDAPFEHALGGAGPRATPEVALEVAPDGSVGGRVYALSAYGALACLDAASGALLWRRDLPAEHGITREEEAARAQYGRSSSPLVAGGLVIVPAGGDAGLVALDAASGAPRWASPARHFSHASPARATLAGVEQVLVVNEDTLSGHALGDGRLLWEHPWPGRTSGDACVSQPVPLPPARVLVTKGYGGGALVLELAPTGGGALAAREVWRDRRILRTKLTNVVVHEGHAYGLDDGMLECVELASGARRWKEGRYGHGQVLLAGELLLVASEDGEVALVEPEPARPNDVLGSFRALEGKCWAHLALAHGVLYVRNDVECAAWRLPSAP